MTEALNESVDTEMTEELDVTEETSEEKAPRKPRTTTYYAFNSEEEVITFSGTKDDAKEWLKENVPPSGNSEISFFRQRSNWWVLMTGEGAGEHMCEEDSVPSSVLAQLDAKPAKTPGAKRSKGKFKAETKLERSVMKWAKGQESSVEEVFKDLLVKGCSEGVVKHLDTHEQTTKFYRKHRVEISMLISDCIRNGLIKNAAELEGWDASDPLAQKDSNQNLLAWFGFEVSVKNLCERAGVEV